MMQDKTADKLTRESGLTVCFDRGSAALQRGYRIVGGAFLGVDVAAARKTLAGIRAMLAHTFS